MLYVLNLTSPLFFTVPLLQLYALFDMPLGAFGLGYIT